MQLTLLTSLLLLPASIFAAAGDRCAFPHGMYDCICLDTDACESNGGMVVEAPAPELACPEEGEDIRGCTFNPCPKVEDKKTYCTWTDTCYGTVRPENVCPGGDNFICCNHLN